jgi:hypothetical protein
VVISLTEEGRAVRRRAAGIPSAIGCALSLEDERRRELITPCGA